MMLIQDGKVKEIYTLNINANDLDDIDPTLRQIIERIKRGIATSNEFSFEIRVVLDGFFENSRISKVIDTFFHDVLDESSIFCFTHIDDDQCNEYAGMFIKRLFSTFGRQVNIDMNDKNLYSMDAVTRVGGKEYYAMFFLPKSRITDAKYDDLRYNGADYLIGQLSPKEILVFVLPYLYMRLAENGLLDRNELRDVKKYMIGLH